MTLLVSEQLWTPIVRCSWPWWAQNWWLMARFNKMAMFLLRSSMVVRGKRILIAIKKWTMKKLWRDCENVLLRLSTMLDLTTAIGLEAASSHCERQNQFQWLHCHCAFRLNFLSRWKSRLWNAVLPEHNGKIFSSGGILQLLLDNNLSDVQSLSVTQKI